MNTSELSLEEAKKVLAWLDDEAGELFFKKCGDRQSLLINALVGKDDNEIRGRIKELGQIMTLKERLISTIHSGNEKSKKAA